MFICDAGKFFLKKTVERIRSALGHAIRFGKKSVARITDIVPDRFF